MSEKIPPQNNSDTITIVAARRTALGSLQGTLSPLSATDLGSYAIKATLEDSKVDPQSVDEVIMGCVLPAGLGQAPARQAALKASLPQSTCCTTINKVCGSAMKAIMMASDSILAGSADRIIAGGMESMSNSPYLLPKARTGYRLGHQQVLDHMFLDGLENALDNQLMGEFAERCVEKYAFSREQQDEFAQASVQRARQASESCAFSSEITPIIIVHRGKETLIDTDEQPFKSDIEKIPTLRPAFRKQGGSVTAANSSSISDGAASVLLMRTSDALSSGITGLANIIAHTSFAQAPEDFTTAPIGAIQKLFDKTGWTDSDIDLYEINEAFAVVTMAAMRDLKLDHAKVNVNGGACALGHPIGASGTRIVVTLIHALKQRGLKRGVASLCIGGGEATALGLEII